MKFLIIVTLLILQTVNVSSQANALYNIANRYKNQYDVPGIAISVITLDQTRYGVAGIKRCGEPNEIETRDKFHIGSNSKAITATIAALLIEEGLISWNTRLIDQVPELKSIRNEYKEITIGDLLSNRGKIQAFEDDKSPEWKGIPKRPGTQMSKLDFAQYALSLVPHTNPNKNHAYSNGGFIIAALMMERAANKTWEQLIMMFNEKYNLNCSIGFPNQIDEQGTFGHKKKLLKYRPVAPEDEYVFPVEFSAAGNMSINILDLSSFVRHHLLGLLGEDNMLKSQTYTQLHYGLDSYSYGWYNGQIGDTDQKFSYHGGSIGTFSSAIMISADRKVAIVILVNSDDKKTNKLKDELRTELWEKYGSLK